MLAATMLVTASLVGLGLMAAPAQRAEAAGSHAGAYIRNFQTFFAWAKAGENVDVAFTQPTANNQLATATVIDPAGASHSCQMPVGVPANCVMNDLTAPVDGIWTIRFDRVFANGNNNMQWSINVQDGATTVPGRVWSDEFKLKNDDSIDINLWYLGSTGHKYAAAYYGYIGIDSVFLANQFGVVRAGDPTAGCISAYSSRDNLLPQYRRSGPECGVPYHVFFEEPAADLPASAVDGAGQRVFVAPPIENPTIENLAFTPSSSNTRSGVFTFDATGHVGNAELLIDANGDGQYGGPNDRTVPISITAEPHQSITFDGKDGQGADITPETLFNATVRITQAGEIHFINNDVEARSGISVTALNGAAAGTSTLYWNDTELLVGDHTPSCLPPVMDGRAGFDSSVAGGVHGWPCYPITNPNDNVSGPWGDVRDIDDWTFNPVDVSAQLEIPNATNYTVVKSSDPSSGAPVGAGDVITYTVDVTQVGNAPANAELTDSLTDVLDDATYNGDVSATVGQVNLDGSTLTWTGTLPVGGTARITYSVTVTGNGDGTLHNAITSAGCATADNCQTTHPYGTYSVVKSSDPASGSSVAVGDVISYTLTVTQQGPGAVSAANLTDQLVDVLDDAVLNGDITASSGVATFDPEAQTLTWSGDLAPGAVVTVTYSVTVNAEGDTQLSNAVISDGCADEASCETEHFAGDYSVVKSSDPASGDTVTAGQVVTYKITVTQRGTGDVTASLTDDLSATLDDATYNADAASDIGEVTVTEGVLSWRSALEPGDVALITYSVTVAAAGTGDGVLTNVVTSEGCATDGDCETEHPLGSYIYSKTSTPAPGVEVTRGDRITYTITVAQLGVGAIPAARVTDNLADVFDDASLTDEPVASSGVAVLAGSTLEWQGDLSPGQVVTITYSVSVTGAGDLIVSNVLSSDDPRGACDPSAACATRHEISSADLAATGGVVTGNLLLSGILLAIVGGLFLAARRRLKS